MQTSDRSPHFRESCLEALEIAIEQYKSVYADDNRSVTRWEIRSARDLPRSSRLQLYKHVDEKKKANGALYKVVLTYASSTDRIWSLGSWHSLFQATGTKKLWDHQIEMIETVDRPALNTVILKQRLQSDGTESNIVIEKTNKKSNRLLHFIANLKETDTESSQPDPISYLVYDITMAPADDLTLDSRIILYYNDFSRLSTMSTDAEKEAYIVSLVTGPLSLLGLHGSPPFISHCDKELEVRRMDYDPDDRLWTIQYLLSSKSNSSNVAGSIDIEPSGGRSPYNMRRWQSTSWEHDGSPLQFASPLRHRKNSFMSSPISFMPSPSVNCVAARRGSSVRTEKVWLPKSNFQKYGNRRGSPALSRDNVFSSSYTFGDHKATIKTLPDILIEISSDPWSAGSAVDVSIILSRTNGGDIDAQLQTKLQDQFAHLCLRCFERAATQKRGEHDHYLSIQHPAQMIQYLTDDISASGPAGSESLLYGENDDIWVQLQLKKRPINQGSFCIYVNGKEWPILEEESEPWIASDDESVDSDHDSISISSGERARSEGGDDDIFIEGMEPLDSTETMPETTVAPKIEPIPLKQTVPEKVDDNATKSQQATAPKTPKVTKPALPETDPPSILKVHGYTDELLQRRNWQVLQKPEPTNNHVAIKKIDVPNSPTGALLSESIWTDCTVWDVKAVISCTGARKVWDNTYEDGNFVHQVSPTCSIWQHKVKGFWLVSPRDYLVFSGVYSSPYQINIYATSCTTDYYDHQALPNTPQGYIRAHLDLWGWRLERAGDDKVSVKFLMQANPQGWIPSYIPNNLSGNSPEVLMHVYNFYKKHGAPPDLIRLEHGSLLDVSYEHNRRSWRCEYVRATELFTTKDNVDDASTLLEVRLSTRLDLGHTYSIVVDPPPSRVRASSKYYDPKGIWLQIEHDEDAIIPQRSKILVLIKPELHESADLLVNGISTSIEKDTTQPIEEKDEVTENAADPTEKAAEGSDVNDLGAAKNDTGPVITSLATNPIDRAQSALAFLVKISDQQFGWTSVSDKDGVQVSKRLGSKTTASKSSDQTPPSGSEDVGELQVPDSLVIIRATKVIEGFSLEEVASLVTDAGSLRKLFDESVEESEILFQGNNGCHVVRQLIKGIFPFKSREVYICACTAYETATLTINTSSTRILYVETLIPDYPGTAGSKHPKAEFYFSGWVLERIDPYTTTTNHPIPSMRATLVASIDLGTAVPTYMSNLLTTGLPKRLRSVEAYLKSDGPPPYLAWPVCAQNFGAGKIQDDSRHQYPNEDGSIDWIKVSTTYDPLSGRLTICNAFQLAPLKPRLPISNAPKPSTSSPQPKARPFSLSTRRASESSQRLPHKRSPQIKPIPAPITSRSSNASESPSSSSRPPKDMDEKTLLLRSIVDLHRFTDGYEIKLCLEGGDDSNQDLSSNLILQVSELAPEPSHLLVSAGKDRPRKHAIKVFAKGLAFLTLNIGYKISMDIAPLSGNQSRNQVNRLTISGILGEEDDEYWHGPIMLNGREIQIDSEVTVAAAAATTDRTAEDKNNASKRTNVEVVSRIEDEHPPSPIEEPPSTPVGGSMVTAALEGVSASVNQIQDFRSRVLLPFKNASSSFLASKELEDEQQSYASFSSSHTDEYHSPSSPPLISVRQQRALSDACRRQEIEIKGLKRRFFVAFFMILLIFILGFILRIPDLDLKAAVEIRSLWRLPLTPGGWTLQLVVARV